MRLFLKLFMRPVISSKHLFYSQSIEVAEAIQASSSIEERSKRNNTLKVFFD